MKKNTNLLAHFWLQSFYIKLMAIVLCLALVHPLFATTTTQDERITIHVRKATAKEFMNRLQKLTKLELVYATKDLDSKQQITYSATDKPVTAVLDDVLKEVGLSYVVEKGIITIFKTVEIPAASEQPVGTASSSSASSAPVGAQEAVTRSLMGKVLDSQTGAPLIGATVTLPNSSTQAMADKDGNFMVLVPAKERTMTVSYLGYEPIDVPITGKSTVAIHLQVKATALEDAVVTGMFTRKQSTYTGAVNTLRSKELERTGSLNLIEAISRLDPSFQLLVDNELGSNPNAIPDIQMRGAGSFSDMKNRYTSSPNQPLFIIDGFEQDIARVFDMDMNRVESVTLLKDATAKAIYGSKGANGVIVIETKRPSPGALRVSYKMDLNIQAPVLSDYKLANAAEKLEVERIAGMYRATDPSLQLDLDRKYQAIHQDVLKGVNTDWLAQPTRVGVGQKHSLNLEGGDERMLYGVNAGFNDVQGVMKGSSRKSYEGGFTLQYRYKNLIFREQASMISNTGVESPYGSFEDYAKMNPYWKLRDDRGNLVQQLGVYNRYRGTDLDGDGISDVEFPIFNPMVNATTNYLNQDKYLDLTNNFYVEWRLPKGLSFTGRVGISNRRSEGNLFYPSNYATLDPNSSYNFRAVKPDAANDAYYKRGEYTRSHENSFNLSSDIGVSYSKLFQKHQLFLNGMYTVSEMKNTLESFKGQGFADNATSISQAKQYMENDRPFGKDSKSREMGFVGSVNYSYDNRYMIDANYRANASSLFGANKRWGHFWSIGAGWNVHQEKFMKEVSWIQNLKLRGSYGYTGSQNFESYLAMSTYAYMNNRVYDDVIGAYLLALSNPDLKWQQTLDKNIGADFSLFKKLNLSVDYYVKTTSDLITPITVIPSTGFANYTENLGKSENKGVELRANILAVSDESRDFYISLFGNMAHNKNRLLKIGDALNSINEQVDKDQSDVDQNPENKWKNKPRVEYAEGESLSAIWGVRSLGIDPYNGEEVFLKKDGTRTYIWDAGDKIVLGDALANVQGSFGFNVEYKAISLSTNFSYRLGGQFYNQTLVNQVENADLQYNVDRRVLTERWNPETPGTPAKYKALSRNTNPTMPTSRFIQDNNELKLSSLNVGYDFRHTAFMKKTNVLERLRLSFAMNDLFRLSTVKAERGISYPYAASFIFSINATF